MNKINAKNELSNKPWMEFHFYFYSKHMLFQNI